MTETTSYDVVVTEPTECTWCGSLTAAGERMRRVVQFPDDDPDGHGVVSHVDMHCWGDR